MFLVFLVSHKLYIIYFNDERRKNKLNNAIETEESFRKNSLQPTSYSRI